MLSQIISARGLSELVLDGLMKDTVIDMGALRGILEETNELRRLSVRNANKIKSESHDELITMIGDLIQFQPPILTELDFGGLGGSAAQGIKLLKAIYETGMQLLKLDISNNAEWTQSDNYLSLLCGILS